MRQLSRQAERLEAILERHDAEASGIKQAVTGVMGNLVAAVHSVMNDEVLKTISRTTPTSTTRSPPTPR